MLAVRHYCLGSLLLVLSAVGCDDREALAPDAPLFASGARTVAAPSKVVATAVAANEIDVTWQDNSDNESGFEIHRAVTGQSAFDLWTTTGPDVTSQSFIGVAAEREYCVKGRAFTARGKSRTYSEFSDSSCASTALPPVAPPQTVVTPLHSSAVSVWWQDNSTNEDGFRVERSLDEEASWTVVATTGPSPLGSLTQGALKSEQPVCYRVIAFNEHGESAPTADCTTPPAGPTGLTASGTAAGGIALAWADNSAVENGYEVQRSGDGYNFAVIAVLGPNNTSYRDASVAAEVLYWYVVRARKDGGGSDRSNTVSAHAATTPPPAPHSTNAYPAGSSAVTTYWSTSSTNQDGFRIERSTDGGATWDTAGTTTWTAFSDPGRASEQPLCYRVVAFNGVGESPPSNTDCTTPPAAPTNLVITAVGEDSVEFSWSDNSGVEDGYELWLYVYDPSQCSEYYEYCDPYVYYSVVVPPNTTSYRVAAAVQLSSLAAMKDGGYSDWAWSTYAVSGGEGGGMSAPARTIARPRTRP